MQQRYPLGPLEKKGRSQKFFSWEKVKIYSASYFVITKCVKVITIIVITFFSYRNMNNICNYCGSTFTSSSGLYNHLRIAKYCAKLRGVKTKCIKCSFCTKTFATDKRKEQHETKCKSRIISSDTDRKKLENNYKRLQKENEKLRKIIHRLDKVEEKIVEPNKTFKKIFPPNI